MPLSNLRIKGYFAVDEDAKCFCRGLSRGVNRTYHVRSNNDRVALRRLGMSLDLCHASYVAPLIGISLFFEVSYLRRLHLGIHPWFLDDREALSYVQQSVYPSIIT